MFNVREPVRKRVLRRARARQGTRDRVLIIVQNLSVPLDRRVWLECQVLHEQGYQVSVICPQGPGELREETLGGVHIYRYPPAPQAEGPAGFAVEFAYSWLRTARLSLTVWRRHGFDLIQACNPPDTYWALAALWRPRGVKFLFDHHDLCPELFMSRFGYPTTIAGRLQFSMLCWLEHMTHLTADHVTTTNRSYEQVALLRGHLPAERVSIVRSGPDTTTMKPEYPEPSIRARAEHLLAYVGIMGPQDGVDNVLLLMDELVHRRGRTGVHAVLMGFGDCLEDLRRQCTELDLDDHVTFTGRVGPHDVAQYLSAADIGLGPDLRTPLNNLSTMNKTMEYMAFGLPTVSFDLDETRVTTGDTGVLVRSGDIEAFADAVTDLLDDDERRVELGVAARQRAVETLDWRVQALEYVRVYDQLLGHAPVLDRWPHHPHAEVTAPGQVDLTDETELRRFLRDHCTPPPADRPARPSYGPVEVAAFAPRQP